MKQINHQTLTLVGGSGFIGKSIIDSYNRGLLKKYNINKINLICRNKVKIDKKKLNLKKIKIFYNDIRTLKKIPKSDLYIYGAEPTDVDIYKKENKKKISNIHKKSISNFVRIISKIKNIKVLYLSSGSVNYIKKKNYINSYKNLYSHLKSLSESKIKNLGRYKIKTSIARCHSFVGPHLPLKKHYAIGNFLYGAKYNKKIILNKRNKVFRSYMYADDMVDWLITILLNSKLKTSIYNVGSNEIIELNDLAKKISALFRKKILILNSTNDSKKIDKYVPNINKTKKDLNVKILYNLKKSLTKVLKYI